MELDNCIDISFIGKVSEGALRINLDNYNEKLIDMLYMPQIKKILLKMIKEEMKKNETN